MGSFDSVAVRFKLKIMIGKKEEKKQLCCISCVIDIIYTHIGSYLILNIYILYPWGASCETTRLKYYILLRLNCNLK